MNKREMEGLIRERHAALDDSKGNTHRAWRHRSGRLGRPTSEVSRDIAGWLLRHGPAYRSRDGSEAYVLEPTARGPQWAGPNLPHCWNAYPLRRDARCAPHRECDYVDVVNRLRDRLEAHGIDPVAFGVPEVGTPRKRKAVA